MIVMKDKYEQYVRLDVQKDTSLKKDGFFAIECKYIDITNKKKDIGIYKKYAWNAKRVLGKYQKIKGKKTGKILYSFSESDNWYYNLDSAKEEMIHFMEK